MMSNKIKATVICVTTVWQTSCITSLNPSSSPMRWVLILFLRKQLKGKERPKPTVNPEAELWLKPMSAHLCSFLPVYFPVAYQWCWGHGEHSDYWVSECSPRQERELALIDSSACLGGKSTGLGIHLGRPDSSTSCVTLCTSFTSLGLSIFIYKVGLLTLTGQSALMVK